MLERAGVRFETDPPRGVDEVWTPGEHPVAYVRRLAAAKAAAVAARRPDAPLLLGADTTVWIDPLRGPLGKPGDIPEARALLDDLFRARRHTVTTAFALTEPGADLPRMIAHETAEVWMRTPSPTELDRYLARGDWTDKAGGYGIQSDAEGWVLEVRGSYSAVVGLPLAQVMTALADLAPGVLS